MESKTKFLGHPIHPMLIVFPLGLLATAVIFDVMYLINGTMVLPTVSYYLIGAGIIGGLAAAIFGYADWLALPNDSRAKNIGLWHGFGNLVIVLMFLGSWLIRQAAPNYVPNTLALLLSFAAVGLALVTAWIGGELVYRLNVGVDPGANVNAPSSLTESTATEPRAKRTNIK